MTSFTPLQLFKLLADDTRLHLTLLLRTQGELYVCELSATLNLSQPRISRHLGCCTTAVFSAIAATANGSTTDFRRTCPPGLPL